MIGPALAVDDLWVAYRTRSRFGWRQPVGRYALRGLDLTLERGRCLGVIGGNGSGKTTLLQAVAGVIRPSRGRIEVRGRVASLVDLSAGFHRDLTGHENLIIGGVLLGLSRAEVQDRYGEIVDFSGLDPEALDWPLAAYSAGMGLRLGFSLVVHSAPDLLLVDEVLAVGDDAFRAQCLDRISQLQESGCAIMVVSHDMDLVRERCDEVAVLRDGELELIDDARSGVAFYLEAGGRRDTDPAELGIFTHRGRSAAARRRQGAQ
ncbi:MAG TPA: ATP-binding cassette domain-containing protein [Acidimicrobiales bacterium]|nr:ATP-binding cassette domain-containing protein [Acidimicrobiales bacterium]